MIRRTPHFAWRSIKKSWVGRQLSHPIVRANVCAHKFRASEFGETPLLPLSLRLKDNINEEPETRSKNSSVGKGLISSDSLTPKRLYQQKARNFLEQVKTGRIPGAVVTQKTEKILLLFLTEQDDNVPIDGPLSLTLLNVGIAHANISKERLIPRLFSLACQIMVRCNHPLALQEAHRQLWRLLDGHEQYLSQLDSDKVHNSTHVNDACSQLIHHIIARAIKEKTRLDKTTRQQLSRLIRQLEQHYENPHVPLEANDVIEDAIILYLCYEQNPQSAFQRLRRTLRKRQECLRNDSYDTPPVSTLVSIIAGFARTNQPDKALEVVKWMVDEPEGSIAPRPTQACFNALLHAYAVSGGRNAGFKANETLEWMTELHESKNLDTLPDITSFNVAINAWARSCHPDAPEHAQRILQHVLNQCETGNDVRPSEETWCSVMSAWINCDNDVAVERVTFILQLMEQLVDCGEIKSFSTVPYTLYVKAWEKEAQRREGQEKQDCADNILQVVNRMEAKGLTPSPEVFNSILTSLKEVAVLDALCYFLDLERRYRLGEIQLATRTFNIGLNLIALLNRPDAEKRAFDVFKRMEWYSKIDCSIKPSALTFNILLKVLSRSQSKDAASRAEDLLQEMDSSPCISPDPVSYATCIIAWGRSHYSNKFEHIVNLLNRFLKRLEQMERHEFGSVAVFNSVLSVCLHHVVGEHQHVSQDTALLVMEEIQRRKGWIRADQTTYSTFFLVFQHLDLSNQPMNSPLLEALSRAFVCCADDGFVTKDIKAIMERVL